MLESSIVHRQSTVALRRTAAAVALFLLLASSASSASPFNVMKLSAGEFARLPEYCLHTLAYNGPDQKAWLERLGNTFTHLHHYCWGLLKALRAEAVGVPAMTRRSLYASAVQECFYVIDRAPGDFVLLPEIYFKLGTFYARLEQYGDAMDSFTKSSQSKPDYWPPYLEAARLNLRLKRPEQAREWLREGLRHSPQEAQLVNELATIEGPRPAHGVKSPSGQP